ncbi:Eco57I restriction-modification methylase domain-containing protein [Virgibacillus necropolis]|uniref:site-specific DNA-methyltransferase (adenine-specific) n=1 Tax=Virgibacillus necropolis TaxID=163877 RepID=A0A221MFE0_9BACI|nr:TaqI-like C-terminal specificity domain-containing protein [Virgibacillus necropolis]ASN06332.1 hypothetical protein CFK40_15540 [Virgibacillus necropolis]
MIGIDNLVSKFDEHQDNYRSNSYNEAQLRKEFIDPFFSILGWDVINKQGYAQNYKEVIHEDSIKIGQINKAPDYCFRYGGARKFFVETKRPLINIKESSSAAYQLRRYGWSANLPLCILTNFEEFSVYNCTIKPQKNDRASIARVHYFKYKDYSTKWNKISSMFSKESIPKGLFDKLIESAKDKHGEDTVDKAFLLQIENWRLMLAKNIYQNNSNIDQTQLNFSVQVTLNRIIFLRICEGRNIEKYGSLKELQNKNKVYPKLLKLFRKADKRYNSGIFHFEKNKYILSMPDYLTPNIKIDDNVINTILKELYFPDSPYEFSVIPSFILGQVYEQFLGKRIKISDNRIQVEDKPEIKKTGGVYYTTSNIVNIMVDLTLKEQLLNQKVPNINENKDNSSPFTIIDPACGSGSFLIIVYDYLLNWYLNYYQNNNPEEIAKSNSPQIYKDTKNEWRLTLSEKKRILTTHIYGVDIDPQAVEVAKMSLLLKVIEGETEESLITVTDRLLPSLEKNIKCGNAIIDTNFYTQYPMDKNERHRINVFNWKEEFPEIFNENTSGFDLVIGNPPWISLSGKFGVDVYSDNEIEYLIKKYNGNPTIPNLYEYFVSKGLSIMKNGGYFSFIVPDRLGFNDQFIELRKEILQTKKLNNLIYRIPFPGITADTLIFTITNEIAKSEHYTTIEIDGDSKVNILQSELLKNDKYKFECYKNKETMKLINKVWNGENIRLVSDIFQVTSGFGGKSKLIQVEKTSQNQISIVKGDSVQRYMTKQNYWFEFKAENLTGRTKDKNKLGANPKILIRKTGNKIIANVDYSGIFPEQSLYFLFDNNTQLDYKYYLGVLNSSLITFYVQNRLLTNKNSMPQLKTNDLKQIPLHVKELNDNHFAIMHNEIVDNVDKLIDLYKNQISTITSHELNVNRRIIKSYETRIDEIVYELYGITEEELMLINF